MSVKPSNTNMKTNQIEITNNQFGKNRVAGMQQKDVAIINGEKKYIKLDTLTPNQVGNWAERYDFKYSSVSEAMVSCLTNNIKSPFGRNVNYQFEMFKIGDKTTSGTISESYTHRDEVEINLGIRGDLKHGQFESDDKYAEEVVDVSPQIRLDNLTKRFVQAGVDEKEAHKFLVQQAGFDVLVGNNDRLKNPGNFTLVLNDKENYIIPVNMDYGRCLQLPIWTDTAEKRINIHEKDIDELTKEFAEDSLGESTSITGSNQPKKSMDFLNQNGYEPLKIDVEGLKRDLHELNEKIQASDVPFKNFAHMKMKTLEQIFERSDIKALYEDVSPEIKKESENSVKLELNLSGLESKKTKGLT